MSGILQNIDPPPPSSPGECMYTPPPALWCGGKDTLAGWRGGGGSNILEDARHSSVLYTCKYFVCSPLLRQHCSTFPDETSSPILCSFRDIVLFRNKISKFRSFCLHPLIRAIRDYFKKRFEQQRILFCFIVFSKYRYVP
jgi:hypothetical protein